jgi:hypothetical protein
VLVDFCCCSSTSSFLESKANIISSPPTNSRGTISTINSRCATRNQGTTTSRPCKITRHNLLEAAPGAGRRMDVKSLHRIWMPIYHVVFFRVHIRQLHNANPTLPEDLQCLLCVCPGGLEESFNFNSAILQAECRPHRQSKVVSRTRRQVHVS